MGSKVYLYEPVYKCALCGKEFTMRAFQATPEEAYVITQNVLNHRIPTFDITFAVKESCHICGDENIGIAHLIGVKKIPSNNVHENDTFDF